MCPAVVSGIVTGTRCVSAIGRAACQLLDALRVSYCIGRAACQLLDALRVSYCIGRAACQLLDALRVSYWTRCVSAIGRAAGQLLASFFSSNIPRSLCVS